MKMSNAIRQAMAAYAREKTNDCKEIYDFFIDVMRGTAGWDYSKVKKGEQVATPPSLSDRMYAANWLDARIAGKPPDEIEGFENLSGEELVEALKTALAQAQANISNGEGSN